MIFSLDEEEMYHDCVMWSGHDGVHVCVCGQTYHTSLRLSGPTRRA